MQTPVVTTTADNSIRTFTRVILLVLSGPVISSGLQGSIPIEVVQIEGKARLEKK
jgi:hypothetical protein